MRLRENARLQLSATEPGMRHTAFAVALTVDKQIDTHLVKPVNPDALLAAVHSAAPGDA
jgi:hypothetical protein